MRVLDKARRDLRVAPLLEHISKEIPLKFQRSKEKDDWGSNLEDGKGLVWYSGCKHPSAALAHELLHIKTQLKGYKRIRIGVSSIASTDSIKTFLECIDNELQHHKFYPEFISLGFRPEQFYRDSDSETEEFLWQQINEGFKDSVSVLTAFFTLIAPGGSLSEESKANIRLQLMSVNSGQYAEMMRKVESIVLIWANSPVYDAVPTIKDIFLTIEPSNNLTWIGFTAADRPPTQGFFVNGHFEVRSPEEESG